MFRLNIFYFICMKRDWLYVVCLIAFLVEHIFIPSDNAVRIIDHSTSLYNISYTYTTFTSLMNLRLIIFCFFLPKVNSWVEDEVVLLKCVDLDVF